MHLSLAAAVLKKNKAHSRRLNHRLTYTIDHLLSTVTSFFFFFYYDAIPNSKIQLCGFLWEWMYKAGCMDNTSSKYWAVSAHFWIHHSLQSSVGSPLLACFNFCRLAAIWGLSCTTIDMLTHKEKKAMCTVIWIMLTSFTKYSQFYSTFINLTTKTMLNDKIQSSLYQL